MNFNYLLIFWIFATSFITFQWLKYLTQSEKKEEKNTPIKNLALVAILLIVGCMWWSIYFLLKAMMM